MNRIGRVLLFLAAVSLATASLLVAADYKCGDFLKEFGRKPKNLEFVGCKPDDGMVDDLWVADYRVAGVHAVEVESFLVKTFGLTPLVKSCCQWDGPPVDYQRNGQGH